ncbi:MAG: alkylhydroperoxidase [Acidimicrobiaceae bacterium]|nr:alkylhydroperoxidase [Acidimicrobiaceae bacterium]
MSRPVLANADPDGFKAVVALEKHLRSVVDRDIFELVWLRASIINGCAFCVDMHSRDALRNGESVDRLLALTAWPESPLFTESERAALALTDAVTRIENGGVDDAVWAAAAQAFGDAATVQLVLAIAAINVWNRVAISTHMQSTPGRERPST